MSSIAHLEIHVPPPVDEPMPKVTLTRRVLEKMFTASLEHMDIETGEAMVGITMMSTKSKLPTMFILDTVSPVKNTVRQWAKFEQGDDWQGAIFNWWYENWEMYRELRRGSYGNAVMAKWDLPLQHLGDWHKQPDGMIHPSGGDMRTAQRLMKELKLDFLLMPIVTFEESLEPITTPNTLAIATHARRMRIDFWWVKRRSNSFDPVYPILESNGGIPRLPEVVWWLANPEQFDAQVGGMEAMGLEVMDIVSWSANGRPPLDTCFIIYRPGNRQVWIAITPANYPAKMPQWRSAPIVRPENDDDLFAALYKASTPVPREAFAHVKGQVTLLEGVKALEEWEKLNA